jgi:crotonobetainyl-CoA:carnitine CoA-transferase CaiB-like acyl-CoA transferase
MELLKELIKKSDVIVENFSSRVLEKWGLGYEEQKKINPKIIYCSMSGFGHSGRDRDFVTWGPTAQALSGLTFMSGLPGEESAGWGFSYMDHTGGFYGTIAIMMALIHRNKTGEGQHIDLSQVETGIALTGTAVLDYTVNNRPFHRDEMPPGNRAPDRQIAPHNSYPCKGDDRWCVIAVTNEDEWDTLVDAVGNPSWAGEDRFASMESRFANQESLDAFIAQWTINHSPYEVFDILQRAGVPAGAVQTPMERAEKDPQLKHRDFIAEIPHEELGKARVESIPMRMSETPWKLERPSPLLGEHSAEIYTELLDVTPEELGTLYEEGIA